jgi:hypothetical protein
MNTSQPPTYQWRRRYGLTSGNPLAPFIIIITVLTVIALIITLCISFIGNTANARWIAGIAFMFVSALSPIPIGLLILYARQITRIQDIEEGNFWVHWYYPGDSENGELFIGPDGLYYPNKPLRLTGFWSGLQSVEIQQGEQSTLNFQYLSRRYYSAALPPLTSNNTLVVPIPSGKETEAEALIPKFRKMLGQPSNFVNDQWRIGWIMGGAILGFVFLSIPLLFSVQVQYDDENRAFLNATATMEQATEIAQVDILSQPIRAVMDKQIERLKTLPDGTMTAEEAGFDSSAGVSAIFYGHCLPDNAFYMYVLLTQEALGRRYLGGPGAFNYTTATDRRYMDCGPEHLISTVPDKLDGGWYYAVIARINSTRTPRIIDTATPTASPS